MSFYDIAKDKLINCELYNNACIGTNQKNTENFDMSMRKLDPYDPVVSNRMEHCFSIDTESGGAGDALERDLRMLS